MVFLIVVCDGWPIEVSEYLFVFYALLNEFCSISVSDRLCKVCIA